MHKEIMMEVSRREKQEGIVPDPDVDAYMKVYLRCLSAISWCMYSISPNVMNNFLLQAISVNGLESTLQTDYILKVF